MKVNVYCSLMGVLWVSMWASINWLPAGFIVTGTEVPSLPSVKTVVRYNKSLRFNVYTFTVAATDSGAIRDLTVKAYRGELLLTNFQTRVDGSVVGAEVADLDNNRFPELYVYTTSDGSGSFGRVYAWQFLPERKADVVLPNWQFGMADGYMGHDSLWVERSILCRKYPIYRPGDANANPTGGTRMVRYQLRSVGQGFALVAAPK